MFIVPTTGGRTFDHIAYGIAVKNGYGLTKKKTSKTANVYVKRATVVPSFRKFGTIITHHRKYDTRVSAVTFCLQNTLTGTWPVFDRECNCAIIVGKCIV